MCIRDSVQPAPRGPRPGRRHRGDDPGVVLPTPRWAGHRDGDDGCGAAALRRDRRAGGVVDRFGRRPAARSVRRVAGRGTRPSAKLE